MDILLGVVFIIIFDFIGISQLHISEICKSTKRKYVGIFFLGASVLMLIFMAVYTYCKFGIE